MKTASVALTNFLAAQSEDPTDLSIFVVDIYTFTLANASVLRYCSGDREIVFGGHTFSVISPSTPGVPSISRSKINSTIGLSVDELTIEIAASPLVLLNGVTFLAALIRGDLDGATVLVQRLFMPTYGDTTFGAVTQFLGLVGDVSDIGSASAKINVKALTELLNIDMPRNLYQPGCRHTLFDAGCTLLPVSFSVNGVVGSSPNVISIPSNLTQPGPLLSPAAAPTASEVSQDGVNQLAQTFYIVVTYVGTLGESTISPERIFDLTQDHLLRIASPPASTGATHYNVYVGVQPGNWQRQNDTPILIGTAWQEDPIGLSQGIPPPYSTVSGYFAQGVITFTSGPNSGLKRTVASYAAGGLITLVLPLPVAPVAGNTFSIVPGCDKQMLTCEQKFNNLINFGGQPFIPQPEASI